MRRSLLACLFIFTAAATVPAAARAEASPGKAVPSEIVVGNQSKKQVIFTFDGGDAARSADAILAALAKHRVKGTFFLAGPFVRTHPDIVKRIAAAGHEIFNHTDTHQRLTSLSDAGITRELAWLEGAVAKLTGSSTLPYFRAPYGDRDARVLAAAARIGYRSVYWTDDALDWEEPRGMTAAQVRARVLKNLNPGEIYLFHVGDRLTGSILDQLMTDIEGRGYRVVSLTQGLI